MMNQVKRVAMCLVLSVALVASAWGAGGDEGAQAAADFGPPGTFPISAETQTLTALSIPMAGVEDMNTNWYSLYVEKMTNVKVEYVLAEGAEKVTVMLNSGEELPDVLLGSTGLNFDAQYLYGRQGIIKPLNDLIDQYTVNVKSILDGWPVYKMTSTRPDGNIYVISAYSECYHCMASQKMYINVKWLETLGLDMPSTTDEFRDVLRAFKTQDPNGNGLADELPLTGATGHWHSNLDGFLMSAFIYNDSGNRLNVLDDGTLIANFIQPEFREGLKYINGLFAEGLVDKEMFVQNDQLLTQIVEGEHNRAGAIPLGHSGHFASTVNPVRIYDYDALPPLTGPEGVRTAGFYPPGATTFNHFAITKDSTKDEIAIRWLDFLMAEESVLYAIYGEKGVDWGDPNPGEIGKDGSPALFNTMGKAPIYEKPSQNKAWVHSGPWFWPQEIFERVAVIEGIYDHHYTLTQQTMNNGYMDTAVRVVLPPLTYEVEDGKVIGPLRQQINQYVNESIAQFIVGDLDINSDADWHEYLDTLDRLELDTYLEIEQRTYDLVR